MASVTKTIRNFYRDSVALMQLSSDLGKLPAFDRRPRSWRRRPI